MAGLGQAQWAITQSSDWLCGARAWSSGYILHLSHFSRQMVSSMNTDTKIFPQNICVPLILVFLCTHAFNFSSARLRVRQVFVRRLQVQRDVLRAAALPLRQDLRLPRQERRGQLPLPQPARRRPRVRGRGGPGERGQPLDPPRQGLRRLLRLPRPQRRGGPQLRQGEGVVRGEGESPHQYYRTRKLFVPPPTDRLSNRQHFSCGIGNQWVDQKVLWLCINFSCLEIYISASPCHFKTDI